MTLIRPAADAALGACAQKPRASSFVVRRVNHISLHAAAKLGALEISVGVSYTTDLPANAKRKARAGADPQTTAPTPARRQRAWTTARGPRTGLIAGDLSG